MHTPVERSESTSDGVATVVNRPTIEALSIKSLSDALARETDFRGRAECMAQIQSDAVQLALDLLVREPDITGFFRAFIKTLVEESESHGCGVWLLDHDGSRCDLWMTYVNGRFFLKGSHDWDTLTLPRESLSEHFLAHTPGWTQTVEYAGDDVRLPEPVRVANHETGVESIVVAPLVLPTRNLGWVALSSGPSSECEILWRRALVEAMAKQATLALHQSRLAEQSRVEERRQAVLEERNRMARDIHDTLAQGFGAILMQLQAAQRSAAALPPAVARSLDTAVDLARTHMIDARRSVSALRPQRAESDDLAAALARMTDLARRTTDVPIQLTVADLPSLDGGVDREIIGIAQEALTNAVRHARAKRISIQASSVRSVGFRLSVADDGRGIAREHRDTGFGMTSMQERAERIGASLTIVTAPRSGTEVVLAWEPPSFSIPGSVNAAR
ncbi:MAG TPA: sensor histidine kinase [Vicinamibacterales bacterium]|jgi:signal transduction histidine kinase|nr:sensor histidine kinase [Vicinamibacterales bacterium]